MTSRLLLCRLLPRHLVRHVGGHLIISNPNVGAATLVRMLGLFAFLAGIILIVIGFRVKKLAAKVAEGILD